MKRHALFATLMLSTLAVQPVLADDAHHPDQKAGAVTPAADQTIQKMQANTKRMQSQLEQMARSKDPAQRQKLMQEHLQTMQENMTAGKSMMGGMMDCPMMKGGMMGGGMGMMGGQGMQGGVAGQDDMMARRMEMMEKRMDMMQMMIQSNMDKPQGEQGKPAK
ncbi:MAG: hypothetical protein KKA22_11745 [Gammaproteobacteria bacterium]|jgi:hypothetical protein|nr:hypothetical protein [Gammaproteobacteria bacterium]MBU1408809.1 hypothetical protein [Gammaproteobacteria bacterium]MBU1532646.1 hypothetical protein [Gammaproteobacteria bacterium]